MELFSELASFGKSFQSDTLTLWDVGELHLPEPNLTQLCKPDPWSASLQPEREHGPGTEQDRDLIRPKYVLHMFESG